MPKFPVLKPRQVITALEMASFRQVREGKLCSIKAEEFTCDCAKPPWGFESACIEILLRQAQMSAEEFEALLK